MKKILLFFCLGGIKFVTSRPHLVLNCLLNIFAQNCCITYTIYKCVGAVFVKMR